jgi:hypothetical protein
MVRLILVGLLFDLLRKCCTVAAFRRTRALRIESEEEEEEREEGKEIDLIE